MEWSDLRIFLAVARTGSTRAAAGELGLSQPTVGRRVRALEAALDASLFDRLPEGHRLTPRGESLLPMAEAMGRAADEIARRREQITDEASGTVRIALDEWTARFVAGALPELHEALPGIDFELHVSHVFANLGRREADLALWDILPDGGPLLSKRIGVVAYAVYGHWSYVEAEPAARGAGRFERCRWVTWDEEHASFHTMVWLEPRLAARQLLVRVSNASTLYDAVRAGAGLGVLPCFTADEDAELVRVSGRIRDLDAPIWRLVHRDLRARPAVRVVGEALETLFERHRGRLRGVARPA